jgi:general secretion pathway protein B
MSYILEALKKADRERAAGHVPDLETVHRHEPVPRKLHHRLWILAALLLSNGVLVALLVSRHDAGSDGNKVVLRATPGERGAAQPEPARAPVPVESPPPVRLPTANAARIAPGIPARPPEAVTPRSAPAIRSPANPGATAAAPAMIETAAPAAAALPPPAPSPATAPASNTIPEWDDLSLDFRSKISMPRMDVHVYDPDPQRRFVLADLQKFREGDRLPNGAVLEKILPDGIVLSYQGTRFHYGK